MKLKLSIPPSLNRPATAKSLHRLVLYADGAISPRVSGAAAVGHDENGKLITLANRSLQPMTNNEAEYAALLLALELALPFQLAKIEVRMDSEIVVYQMRGRFSVHSPALKVLHREACSQAMNFQSLTFTHVPRELNRVADALAAEAVLGHFWTIGS